MQTSPQHNVYVQLQYRRWVHQPSDVHTYSSSAASRSPTRTKAVCCQGSRRRRRRCRCSAAAAATKMLLLYASEPAVTIDAAAHSGSAALLRCRAIRLAPTLCSFHRCQVSTTRACAVPSNMAHCHGLPCATPFGPAAGYAPDSQPGHCVVVVRFLSDDIQWPAGVTHPLPAGMLARCMGRPQRLRCRQPQAQAEAVVPAMQ
jgi:hypothetical protein